MFGFKAKKKNSVSPVVVPTRSFPVRRSLVSPEEMEYEMKHSNLSAADRAELAAISEVQRTGRVARQLR